MLTLRTQTEPQLFLTAAYHDYEKELSAYAFWKTHNSAICQDLVQETFVRTWQYLLRRGKIDATRAFLYHVLNNLIVDEYRKHKLVSLDVLLEHNIEPGSDPSEQMCNRIDGEEALKLVRRLPSAYREVMRMRYVQGLSLEEIAERTGRSRNSVSVQLHRGLAKLKIICKTKRAKRSMKTS